jgi:hypothetical protein
LAIFWPPNNNATTVVALRVFNGVADAAVLGLIQLQQQRKKQPKQEQQCRFCWSNGQGQLSAA